MCFQLQLQISWYINWWISFTNHIQQLVKRLKLKLSFHFRIKSCLPCKSKKIVVAATFMSVLDYSDVVYMQASSQSLHTHDTHTHWALRFITGFKALTHHCTLYEWVEWSSISIRRLRHLHILIYKAILGFLPSYLLSYINQNNAGTYNLRSQDLFLLSVPKVRTELGKKAFRFAAPSAWNTFKGKLDDLEAKTSGCRCFAWGFYYCSWPSNVAVLDAKCL